MTDTRDAIFTADDPFALARRWLAAAEQTETSDANAMALATSGPDGMPNVRIVLLKEIEGEGAHGGFVFYTNYESAKGVELAQNPQAAFAMHWKSIRRQMRARGPVEKVEPAKSDAYYASRPYQSRIGAWASQQSRPLSGRAALVAEAARIAVRFPRQPPRPEHWGGYRIRPLELEFWADGDFRLHDRFRWTRPSIHAAEWTVTRLSP